MRKKILFLVPYPLGIAPSQRFRFEQYLVSLRENGYDYRIQSFIRNHSDYVRFFEGRALDILLISIRGFLRRIGSLFISRQFDMIFIHREAAPVGPPIFEFLLAKVLKKPIVFDFDDAIWLTDRVDEGQLRKMAKWRSKVAKICKWSFTISCGNNYLCDYARKFSSRVVLNPTTIDLRGFVVPEQTGNGSGDVVHLGWTGSHSTLKYLESMEVVLQELEKRYPYLNTIVIADKPPKFKLSRVTFLPWRSDTEISDLSKIDIGIMPLPEDEWTQGKCGFKALQYMAMGIPAVVSPVGVNNDIVKHGFNGFIAKTNKEWLELLSQLIEDRNLRKRIGAEGSKTVLQNYSLSSNVSNFLDLFG